jgi:hypothetical protein
VYRAFSRTADRPARAARLTDQLTPTATTCVAVMTAVLAVDGGNSKTDVA